MTPPEAPEATTGIQPPAVSSCPKAQKHRLQVLRKRADFLAAARARRQATKGMVVQARRRPEGHTALGVRIGYTCSKKIGNAVARNRAKRRLRAVARELMPALSVEGWDYVLIGRREDTIARSYDALLNDLKYAMKKLHADRSTPRA